MNKITGNISADMISACIDHYKKYGKRVKTITLSHGYWNRFKEWLKKEMPGVAIDDVIEFKNVTIKKGSIFQIDHLKAETYKTLAAR